MTLIFVLAVLVGFLFHFLGTFPAGPYCARIAWGSWLVAAVIWALPQVGLH